jgi:glycolate oxidase iron-sulfur subunit
MRTDFTAAQLADPQTAASQGEIRKCVHCGFCTATCPTYVLLGDERDSPRGRIELIRAMLEDGGAPSPATVTHLDRCLSCLACNTTCPSGVDYGELIDHARAHVEATYRRPWAERLLRWALVAVLTRPRRLRAGLMLGRIARPLEPMVAGVGFKRLAALMRSVPLSPRGAKRSGEGEGWGEGGAGRRDISNGPPKAISGSVDAEPPSPQPSPSPPSAGGEGARRVILLRGCVEDVTAPQIQAAASRLLARMGFEVVRAAGEGCCGAIPLHLGRKDQAERMVRANQAAWARVGDAAGVVTTAAGCGTQLKAHRDGPKAYDILEFLAEHGLPPVTRPGGMAVAYHAACSLQHGQGIRELPVRLLAEAGYDVRLPAEGHLCCGSAGTYSILQPELSGRLRARKAANLRRTEAAVVAAGNVGCMAQLAPALETPIVHAVELLDWATGGPKPAALG